MKKSAILLIILLIGMILITTDNQLGKNSENPRILEANLLAAIALDNKIITTCGVKTFDFSDTKVEAPIFSGLGEHTFAITTNSKKAIYC